eukprot:IDg3868t1
MRPYHDPVCAEGSFYCNSDWPLYWIQFWSGHSMAAPGLVTILVAVGSLSCELEGCSYELDLRWARCDGTGRRHRRKYAAIALYGRWSSGSHVSSSA